ncbi:MAG: DNA polymerase IV [Planctomycetota bacterium]
MKTDRCIIHVDMDAFFAAIEQRDNPEFKGQPVVVGADPEGGDGRGVVSTCSYEARRYGIHSAQPISEAYRRCPHAVFLPVNGRKYAQVSRQIREILERFSPQIEPLSIDEAFLDVTDTKHLFGGKLATARRIRNDIKRHTKLTASLGLGPNKMVAKIASDLDKPDGLVVVEPGEVMDFLHPLDIETLWGVGPRTAETLHEMKLTTIGDIADTPANVLEQKLGTHGRHLWKLAHGMDNRPVSQDGQTKSIGHEHTFGEDTDDRRKIEGTMMTLCEKVARRLRQKNFQTRTVTTRVRLEDFSTFTRSSTPGRAINGAPELYEVAMSNFERVARGGCRIRLIGVSASNLEPPNEHQTSLFAGQTNARQQRLNRAIDTIKDRFGNDALRHGTSLLTDNESEKPAPDNAD